MKTFDEHNKEANARLELRTQITAKKLDAFDLMKMYIELGNDIKQAGFNTVGDALIKCHQDTSKKIESMVRAHEKKYPD